MSGAPVGMSPPDTEPTAHTNSGPTIGDPYDPSNAYMAQQGSKLSPTKIVGTGQHHLGHPIRVVRISVHLETLKHWMADTTLKYMVHRHVQLITILDMAQGIGILAGNQASLLSNLVNCGDATIMIAIVHKHAVSPDKLPERWITCYH